MNVGAKRPLSEKSNLIQRTTALFKKSEWLGLLAITSTFLFMLFMGWRRSGDLLVDFGRELYVPWRIVQGDVLYTEIAYFNGPLSPYLNSLWFHLFGSSLTTLLIANLVNLTGLSVILYRLLSDMAGRHSASIATLIFVTGFALGHLVGLGNYNYLTPYSHEMTHGVTLALLTFFLLSRAPHWRNPLIALAGAGISLGLTFLTKPEIFLALGLAMPIALTSLGLNANIASRYSIPKMFFTFVLAAFLPPVTAFILMRMAMPLDIASKGLLGAWYWMFNRNVISFPFYNKWMGLADPAGNLWKLLVWTGKYVMVFSPALICSYFFRKRYQLVGAVLSMAPLVLLVYWYFIDPMGVARPLPLIMAGVATIFFVKSWQARGFAELLSHRLFLLAFVIFAGALLAKITLNSRIVFYGFVLAMPATMVVVLALTQWVPRWIDSAGGSGHIFRLAGLGFASILLLIFTSISFIAYQDFRAIPVGEGENRLYVDKLRGPLVNSALREIAQLTTEGNTLCVFPRGAMLNFFTQRRCSSPYFDFHPFELYLYGEEKVLQTLQSHPPDYILLVHLPMYEEEMPYFGLNYARQINAWIKAQYRPVHLYGSLPFQGDGFGLLLMQRSDSIAPHPLTVSKPLH